MTEQLRVMSFHAWISPDDKKAFSDQLFRANRYYNALLEDGKRPDYQDVRRKFCPELSALEEQLAELDTQIEEQGGRKKAPKELRKQRSELAKQCKPLRDQVKQELGPADDEEERRIVQWCKAHGFQVDEPPPPKPGKKPRKARVAPHGRRKARAVVIAEMLEEPQWSDYWKAEAVRREDERKRKRVSDGGLRKDCGVQPGTYLAVERSVQQAFRTAKFGPPHFKRFTGEGKIGVQIADAIELPTDGPFSIFSGQIQIDELRESWVNPLTGKKLSHTHRRHAQTSGRIRIGAEGRKPIWVNFNVSLHRRPVGKLLWAYLVAKRTGTRTRYELQLTVSQKLKYQPTETDLAVAVNIGWRSKRDGCLRIAYLVDTADRAEELALFPKQRDAITYSDAIKELEDFYFNRWRDELAAWLRANRKRISPELKKATQHIAQWRAHRKLAHAAFVLVQQEMPDRAEVDGWWARWRLHRKTNNGDDLLAPWSTVNKWLIEQGVSDPGQRFALYGDWWRRKNRHLYQIECNRRTRGCRSRREVYRLWARALCDRYPIIYMDDTRLNQIAARPPKGTVRTKKQKRASRNRTVAACSTLRNALLSAARPGQIVRVIGRNFTQRCSKCGRISKDDTSHNLIVTCPACGFFEDQDARFCRNILRAMVKEAA